MRAAMRIAINNTMTSRQLHAVNTRVGLQHLTHTAAAELSIGPVNPRVWLGRGSEMAETQKIKNFYIY